MPHEGPHCPVCGQKAYSLPLFHLFRIRNDQVYQCVNCQLAGNGPLRWTININGDALELHSGRKIPVRDNSGW